MHVIIHFNVFVYFLVKLFNNNLMKIIVASSNEHKVKEINEILKGSGINAISLKEANIDPIDVEENGTTFQENALIKAKAISDVCSNYVISDDSGLVVHALNGFPGIKTARFASECGGYDSAMEKLNSMLKDKCKDAHFECVICLIKKNEEPRFFLGRVDGEIIEPIKGDNGFGYDPCFKPRGYNQPFSKLDKEIKNSISHRYRALKSLKDFLSAS